MARGELVYITSGITRQQLVDPSSPVQLVDGAQTITALVSEIQGMTLAVAHKTESSLDVYNADCEVWCPGVKVSPYVL